MKRFFIVISLIGLFLISGIIGCDDNSPGKVTVLVKADGKFWPNITVKLYVSVADRDADNPFLEAVTGSVAPDVNGAVFTNLPPQTYYLKAIFIDGLGQYEGNAEVAVSGGDDLSFTLNCSKAPSGNLKVFVRKDLPSGVYMGNVSVYLYKSEADRTAGKHIQVSATSDVNPTTEGALFTYLTFQRYYLKANFETGGKNYEGLGDVVVPINTTTSYHLVCPEK